MTQKELREAHSAPKPGIIDLINKSESYRRDREIGENVKTLFKSGSKGGPMDAARGSLLDAMGTSEFEHHLPRIVKGAINTFWEEGAFPSLPPFANLVFIPLAINTFWEEGAFPKDTKYPASAFLFDVFETYPDYREAILGEVKNVLLTPSNKSHTHDVALSFLERASGRYHRGRSEIAEFFLKDLFEEKSAFPSPSWRNNAVLSFASKFPFEFAHEDNDNKHAWGIKLIDSALSGLKEEKTFGESAIFFKTLYSNFEEMPGALRLPPSDQDGKILKALLSALRGPYTEWSVDDEKICDALEAVMKKFPETKKVVVDYLASVYPETPRKNEDAREKLLKLMLTVDKSRLTDDFPGVYAQILGGIRTKEAKGSSYGMLGSTVRYRPDSFRGKDGSENLDASLEAALTGFRGKATYAKHAIAVIHSLAENVPGAMPVILKRLTKETNPRFESLDQKAWEHSRDLMRELAKKHPEYSAEIYGRLHRDFDV